MMRQCEAVLFTMVTDVDESGSQWLTKQCLEWLPYADRYKLHRWMGACDLAGVLVHDGWHCQLRFSQRAQSESDVSDGERFDSDGWRGERRL